MKKTLAVFAVLVALPLLASAGELLTIADTVLANARIEAIDHDARELTLVISVLPSTAPGHELVTALAVQSRP